MRRVSAPIVTIVLILLSSLVPLVPRKAFAEPARSGCGVGRGPALSELSCELAAGLGERATGALVAGVTPTGEPKIAVRAELGARMAALVAGALGKSATAWPSTESSTRARSLGQGSRPLVLVTTRIVDTRIEVSADAYVGRETLWRRVRRGGSGPVAHAFASRPLDPEVKSFLPAVPLVAREVMKASGADRDTVALACGDADGDGAPEIAALGRRRVTIGRLRGGRVETAVERPLAALSPIAPAPLREPIAAAWFAGPGVLELGSTDRAFALRLDGRLETLAALGTRVPWPGGGCAPDGELGVGSRVTPCVAGDEAPTPAPAEGAPFDTVAGARIIGKGGTVSVVRATRTVGASNAVVTAGARTETVENAGAQLALGDLDGDGTAEVVTSLDTRDPSTDAVVVRSLLPKRGVKEWFRVPVPNGVRAISVCPLRAAAMAPIVVSTGDELWVIR